MADALTRLAAQATGGSWPRRMTSEGPAAVNELPGTRALQGRWRAFRRTCASEASSWLLCALSSWAWRPPAMSEPCAWSPALPSLDCMCFTCAVQQTASDTSADHACMLAASVLRAPCMAHQTTRRLSASPPQLPSQCSLVILQQGTSSSYNSANRHAFRHVPTVPAGGMLKSRDKAHLMSCMNVRSREQQLCSGTKISQLDHSSKHSRLLWRPY